MVKLGVLIIDLVNFSYELDSHIELISSKSSCLQNTLLISKQQIKSQDDVPRL